MILKLAIVDPLFIKPQMLEGKLLRKNYDVTGLDTYSFITLPFIFTIATNPSPLPKEAAIQNSTYFFSLHLLNVAWSLH